MSSLMQFYLAPTLLDFEAGGDYPAKRVAETFQVVDRNASGGLVSEDLGTTKFRRVLQFNLMSKTDYDALLDFFINTANGTVNEFQFTDEYGDIFEGVKFIDTVIDFDETSLYSYSGSVTLEW